MIYLININYTKYNLKKFLNFYVNFVTWLISVISVDTCMLASISSQRRRIEFFILDFSCNRNSAVGSTQVSQQLTKLVVMKIFSVGTWDIFCLKQLLGTQSQVGTIITNPLLASKQTYSAVWVSAAIVFQLNFIH